MSAARRPIEHATRRTPYDKGRDAGRAHWNAWLAWKAGDHSEQRPVKCPNPYPTGTGAGRRAGAYQWDCGFADETRQAERRERER